MTNITVNQLLDLAATNNLKLNFYDEVHQLFEDTCEQDMAADDTMYNWGEAIVEHWYPENENTLCIKCTLPNTAPLKLLVIAVSLDVIAESLSLIRDNACKQHKFDELLDRLDNTCKQHKFDELLDRLHTWRAELCSRSKDPRLTAEDPDAMKATAALLQDLDEFIINIMVAAEPERETDACAVNILNSECITTLTLTR